MAVSQKNFDEAVKILMEKHDAEIPFSKRPFAKGVYDDHLASLPATDLLFEGDLGTPVIDGNLRSAPF